MSYNTLHHTLSLPTTSSVYQNDIDKWSSDSNLMANTITKDQEHDTISIYNPQGYLPLSGKLVIGAIVLGNSFGYANQQLCVSPFEQPNSPLTEKRIDFNGIKSLTPIYAKNEIQEQRKISLQNKLKSFIEKKDEGVFSDKAKLFAKAENIFKQVCGLNFSRFSVELTPMNVLNINLISEGNNLLMLSFPLSNNVVDLSDKEVVFSYFENKIFKMSGAKTLSEVINYVKEVHSSF